MTAGPPRSPDVLVIGAGMAGAAVAYECVKRGLTVAVLDAFTRHDGAGDTATMWTQAGASWLNHVANDAVRPLVLAGLARHRTLPDELGMPTEFRSVPSFSVIHGEADAERIRPLLALGAAHGARGEILGEQDALREEPALAPGVAYGAVRCQQGHVHPTRLAEAYLSAAERLGASVRHGVEVRTIPRQGPRVAGVSTSEGLVQAGAVVVAAGAWTRRLLHSAGADAPVLHTHAEILITSPVPPLLRHYVGVADPARAALETAMAAPDLAARWQTDGLEELLPPAVQLGAIQFQDGHIRLGQVSRAIPGFTGRPEAAGEERIRAIARRYFPPIADLPATLHGAPVAISTDRLPIAGRFQEPANLFVATGYDSPYSYIPALAQRLTAQIAGDPATDLATFRPDRA
ncbi:MAG: FAD-dependent oxidoreductase [Chloroflexota bacterium]